MLKYIHNGREKVIIIRSTYLKQIIHLIPGFLSPFKLHSSSPYISSFPQQDVFWQFLQSLQRWKVFLLQMALKGTPDAANSREGERGENNCQL